MKILVISMMKSNQVLIIAGSIDLFFIFIVISINVLDKMFTLKKWNAVAMWSWDVECDTCAICRVQVMGKC